MIKVGSTAARTLYTTFTYIYIFTYTRTFYTQHDWVPPCSLRLNSPDRQSKLNKSEESGSNCWTVGPRIPNTARAVFNLNSIPDSRTLLPLGGYEIPPGGGSPFKIRPL